MPLGTAGFLELMLVLAPVLPVICGEETCRDPKIAQLDRGQEKEFLDKEVNFSLELVYHI